MNKIWIPAQMQLLTNGQTVVEVEANNIRQVIQALEKKFPGLTDYIVADEMLKPGVAVVIDGEVSNLGLYDVLNPDSEIHFIPAIEGG